MAKIIAITEELQEFSSGIRRIPRSPGGTHLPPPSVGDRGQRFERVDLAVALQSLRMWPRRQAANRARPRYQHSKQVT